MGTDWLAEYHPRFAAAPQSSIISVNEFYVIMGVIPNSRRGCRDKALYTTIFYTGARRDAIRRLRWADVDLKDRTARIKTKGRKEQLVTIPVPAARSLNLWRLKCPSDTWVFPAIGAKTDRPISGSSVTRQLPRYAKAAGIHKRVYVHLLRHSCATHLVDSGASLDVVQAVLGHASIRTTQIYARMSQKRIAAALDQAFPDIIMKGE
ncbi:MAG: tyrosine-type recombinase/integrase [Bryobacteraceae bacterium]